MSRRSFSSQRLTYTSGVVLLAWIVLVTILIWLAPPESASDEAGASAHSFYGTAIDMLR